MTTKKKALLLGITGQDGAYLAQLLHAKDYEIYGSTRSIEDCAKTNLKAVGMEDKVILTAPQLTNLDSVVGLLQDILPDEIYNLGGETSVGRSFTSPADTHKSITLSTHNILEAMRILNLPAKFFNPCSGECFGNTTQSGATEQTAFSPQSPYAKAKAAAYHEVIHYRKVYGIHACSGLLFNHESPLRGPHFVTKKIVSSANLISEGKLQSLKLGNINISRDWGWAPDYTRAMWLMLQLPHPEDLIISTGVAHSLKEFIQLVFQKFELNWEQHVVIDKSLVRPAEIRYSAGNPSKAKATLDWTNETSFEKMINKLVIAEKMGEKYN